MNNTLARTIFHLIEHVRGEKVASYLKELEGNQFLARDEISMIQAEKLRSLLIHATTYNNYYKEKYKGHDIDGPFERLPILTKEELRMSYKEILSGNKLSKLDLVETSGSTGIPLKFYRDRVIFGYTLASMWRARRWWGIDIGDKEAMLWGVPVRFTGKIKVKAKDFLLNRFRERQYNLCPDTLYHFYSQIKRKKPDYLFGYSSMVYEFAIFLRENNLHKEHGYLKAAICTAEKIYPYQRTVIEETLGCRVVSEYGSTETGIISYECQSGTSHISDDCVYVEIVDQNNNLQPEGEAGRVLVTVLNSLSSPIIRYDLGDIATKLSGGCPCGRNLSILGEIEGRTSDVVIGPNGKIFHSIIFYYIVKALTEKVGGIKHFKVIQTKIDELEFHLVKSEDFQNATEVFIKEQINKKFGSSMKLKFVYCDTIRRSPSGKLRDFETELDTNAILLRHYGAQ